MPAHSTPGFNGSRLREAREARGLTAASLAELLAVSAQAISQWEHGQTAPTPDKLYVLAAHLNLPMRFFLQASRPEVDRVVFFRSQTAASKAQRQKSDRRLEWLEDLVHYLATFVEFPTVSFPTEAARLAPWAPSAIEDAARHVRMAWGVPDGPISDMLALVERHGGIATRGIVETETIDAFSVRLTDEQRPAFFLGADKDSAVRSRFDAAHELGHHILHRDISRQRLVIERSTVEHEAHRFASAFLLPASEFARDLRAPTMQGMLTVKSRWGVSIGAMIQRCADLEILRPLEAQRLWATRAKRGWSRREPLDDTLPCEQPSLLRKAIELLDSEGVRTRDQLLSELPFGAGDIEAFAGLPEGFFAGGGAPVRLIPRVLPNPETNTDEAGSVIGFPKS